MKAVTIYCWCNVKVIRNGVINLATIVEIAKKANVSPMTVSNVINKKYSRVSKETSERVQRAIEELNYVPNMSARSLVSKNSKIVVLAIPQTIVDDPNKDMALINPFYGELINSVEFNLRQNGYYMMLRFISDTELFSSMVANWNADGVIVLGAMDHQLDLNFKNTKTPLVLIDSYVSNGNYDSIKTDDELGGFMATEYLIQHKHNRISMIASSMSDEGVAKARFEGFERALTVHGIQIDPTLVFEGYPTYDYGFEVGKLLSKRIGDVDAVFAYSDLVAIGLMQSLKEEGVRIPQDVSVIGFDGLFIGKISEPQLTTIKQDIYAKGSKAVELLVDRILGKTTQRRQVVMPVSLVERASVK